MRIERIETIELRLPWGPPAGGAARTWTVHRIHAEGGLVGIGRGGSRELIERHLAPLLVGEDPRRTARLWQRMYDAAWGFRRSGASRHEQHRGPGRGPVGPLRQGLRRAGVAPARGLPVPRAGLRRRHRLRRLDGRRGGGPGGEARGPGLPGRQVPPHLTGAGGRPGQGRGRTAGPGPGPPPDDRRAPPVGRAPGGAHGPGLRALRPLLDRGAGPRGRRARGAADGARGGRRGPAGRRRGRGHDLRDPPAHRRGGTAGGPERHPHRRRVHGAVADRRRGRVAPRPRRSLTAPPSPRSTATWWRPCPTA